MTNLTSDEKMGLPIVIVMAMIVALRFFTPAFMWFDVRTMDVQHTQVGDLPEVDFDRAVVRPFQGSWQVVIRKLEPWGWVGYCSTDTNYRPYLTDSALPNPLYLDWFTADDTCYESLPCGQYDIIVTWKVWPRSIIFERTVSRTDRFNIVCPAT